MATAETPAQAAALQYFQTVLAQVPPGANPFLFFAIAFQDQLVPPTPPSYVHQLYALSGITATLPIVVVACAYVRWTKDAWWLFRVQDSFIMPQFTCTWLAFFGLFACIEQGFIWRTIEMAQDHLKSDVTLWRTLTWIPVWIAFWCSCWSLAVAHVFHIQGNGRGSSTILSSSAFLNTGGIGIPILFIISVTVLSISASSKYKNGLTYYNDLQSLIAAGGASYNGTLNVEALLAGSADTLTAFATTFTNFLTLYRWVNTLWFIWCALLGLAFLTVASVHLRSLRKTMSEMHRQSDTSGGEEEKRIRKTYFALLMVLASFLVIACIFCGVFLYLGVDVNDAAKKVAPSEIASILPVYLFAVLGLPLLLFLLYKSLELPNPHEPVEASQGSKMLGSGDTTTEAYDLPTSKFEGYPPPPSHTASPAQSDHSVAMTFVSANEMRIASPKSPAVLDMGGEMEEIAAPTAYPARTLQSSPLSISTASETSSNGWWRKS